MRPAACSPTAWRRTITPRRAARSAALRSSAACGTRSNRSSPRWSAPAARACSSPPTSTSTASPRPPTSSIPKAACCAPARRARKAPRPATSEAPVSVGNELPGATPPANPTAPRERDQSKQVRGDRQLRDLALDQDRGDRRRPHQARLGRGAGRRQLHQERQGRRRLPAARQGGARPHRRAGAHRDRLRPEARRPGRDRQPALCRSARDTDPGADRLARRSCNSPRTTSCGRSSSS